MFVALMQLAVFAAIFIYTQFIDYLDWHGRSDVLKAKHPKMWTLVNNRPTRLIISLFVLGFLVKDFRDAVAIASPPLIKIVPPVPPAMIFNAPSLPVESRDSLRRRTIGLADEYYKYARDRVQGHPPNALEGAGNFRIVEAQFPKSAADQFMRWERLDSIGPARFGTFKQMGRPKIKLRP
jgi:hypothetical protein